MRTLVLVFLSSLIIGVSPANSQETRKVRGAHWGFVKDWSNTNNRNIHEFHYIKFKRNVIPIKSYSGLRPEDSILLNQLEHNGGFLYNAIYNQNNEVIGQAPDTVSVWGYLAEMGLTILNHDDDLAAKEYLTKTRFTAQYYENALFKVVNGISTQGRLINRNSLIPQLYEDSDLPFNMNAAFAYFCAVRNALNKQTYGAELANEKLLAEKIYSYLDTKIFTVVNPYFIAAQTDPTKEYVPGTNLSQPSTLVVWKYNNEINNDSDDVAHAGFAARALAFGAHENLPVNSSYVDELFTYTAPMARATKEEGYGRQFMNMLPAFEIS